MGTIIHIGGNKTGSTTLQRRLFSKHPQIRYLGEDCEAYGELKTLLDGLVSDDDSYYDSAKIKKIFSERFGAVKNAVTCVFSNEDIMTSPMPSVCAARLKELLPDAKIVMVLRNQMTVWPSWYVNHGAYLKSVPRRYWRKHVSFEEWLDYCFTFPKQTPVEAMNYEKFFKIFRKEFPESQIHVLLYEDLIANPKAYYKQWAGILEIGEQDVLSYVGNHVERRRYSQRRMVYDRWVSRLSVVPGFRASQEAVLRLVPALKRWLESGAPAKAELPESWKNRIWKYYCQTNASLAEMTGLDLACHGYPL